MSKLARRLLELSRRREPLRARGEWGAAAVEFGLLLPFFFLLTAGIAEIGLNISRYNIIVAAAREGARAGSAEATTTAAQTTANTAATQYLTAAGINTSSTVTATSISVSGTSAISVQVQTQWLRFFTYWSSSTRKLNATAVMRRG